MKRIFLLMAALCCIMASSVYAACTAVNASYLSSGLSPMTTDNSTIWKWDSYNYAKATAYQQGLDPSEANLFTPTLDMSGAETVSVEFQHVHRYCASAQDELTLWVTDNYQGSYASSTWKQLTISTYASGSDWKDWKTVSINVPVSYVGAKTVFALHYKWTSSSTGTWEVKNFSVKSTCAGGAIASPVPLPEVGDGRLRIFAQNLRNYYFHYDNYESDRANYDHAAFAKKTRQIVDAMMMVNADIFALCEVEAQPEVLVQLADSMNKRVEGEPFVAVEDGINEEWNSIYDNNIKAGFIYRKDKVKLIGANNPAATAAYYKNTQRIQTFEEIASKQRFTLAMNHFKAKDSSDDKGNSNRVKNANDLLSGLAKYASDPDILILGDLNCQVGEEPITILTDAGYEELIIKSDADAYSHCYLGDPELIDHVLANASMAEQITGAGIFHICTDCGEAYNNSAYRYSDHDAYVVAINLPMKQAGECEDIDQTYLQTGGSSMNPMLKESISGTYTWSYQSSYGATCQDRGGEDWLITPTYDLSQMKEVSLEFEHTIGSANVSDMKTEHTLWVTSDFQSTAASSTWQQLTIPTYPTGTNWTFVTAKVTVPTDMVGENTAFAFKYKVPSDATNKPKWEIKNLKVKASCGANALHQVEATQRARKTIENGALYLTLPDGAKYNVIGIRIR